MILNKLGYKRFFYVQRIIFRQLGIDVTVEHSSVKQPLLTWLPTASMLLLMTTMVHYTWKNRSEMEIVTDAMTPFVQMALTFWKLLIYVVNQEEILKLVRTIWAMSNIDNAQERTIIIDFNKKDSYFSAMYYIAVFITGWLVIILPLIITTILYIKTGELQLLMPLKGSYFFDYTLPWNYLFLSIWTMSSVIVVINGSCALDTLYSWFVLNLVAQFRILNMRVKHAAALRNPNHMENAIIECIRFHQRIIDFSTNLDAVFRPIIFVQFTISCLQLCFVCFQIGMGSANKNILFFVMFFVAVWIQMCLYCIGGQLVQNESEYVADNIYKAFHWENLSKKVKKLLLITMLRAHKCCSLTGIFFVVDMSLFLWVFRTTGSYVTMLWTLDGNAKN